MQFKSSLIWIVLFAFACGGKLEKEEKLYPDGKVKIEKYYKIKGNSKLLQLEKRFYPNGAKEMEGEYKDGVRHGKWVFWYSTGQKWSEGIYKNGKREQEGIVWHPNGKIQIKGIYKDGLMVGEWLHYDSLGIEIKRLVFDESGKLIKNEDLNRPVPFR